jgi:hypothetical protein
MSNETSDHEIYAQMRTREYAEGDGGKFGLTEHFLKDPVLRRRPAILKNRIPTGASVVGPLRFTIICVRRTFCASNWPKMVPRMQRSTS